jgi:membrane-bound lytic murein transglycosylase B
MSARATPIRVRDRLPLMRETRCRVRIGVILLLLLIGTASPADAADWTPLTERLAADGLDRQKLETLFNRSETLFEPDAMAAKLKALIRTKSGEADSLAAAFKTALHQGYLSYWAISEAHSYLLENKGILENITAKYGVPEEIVVSILLIETRLGKNTGNRRVFNRLASMAVCTDLEIIRPYMEASLITPENEEYTRRRCREKADWAYDELKALLLYAGKDGIDPLSIRGSIYGAIGLCQFMPTNVFSYGVDADQDGRIDPFTKADALHSIANYLRGHGWRAGMDREGQQRVIFDYNHSTAYANTVLIVADKIRERSRTRQ